MPYLHSNSMVNIAGFEAIIWSFLQENSCDCNVTTDE